MTLRQEMAAINMAALLASIRDVTVASNGVISGPGNQGTANTAHMIGQAGTAANRLSLPRQGRFGSVAPLPLAGPPPDPDPPPPDEPPPDDGEAHEQ